MEYIGKDEILLAIQGLSTQMNEKMDNLEESLNKKIAESDIKQSARMDGLGSEILTLHGQIKAIKDNLDIIQADVNILKIDSSDIKGEMKEMKDRMLDNFVELKELHTQVDMHEDILKVVK